VTLLPHCRAQTAGPHRMEACCSAPGGSHTNWFTTLEQNQPLGLQPQDLTTAFCTDRAASAGEAHAGNLNAGTEQLRGGRNSITTKQILHLNRPERIDTGSAINNKMVRASKSAQQKPRAPALRTSAAGSVRTRTSCAPPMPVPSGQRAGWGWPSVDQARPQGQSQS